MENLIGKRFERLLVKSYAGIDKNKRHYWICECDCGNKTKVISHSLQSKHTKSCGCYSRDKVSQRRLKHGHTLTLKLRTAEYRAWSHIKSRCYNKNVYNYCDYGGRGIKVCDRWLESFENFLADMGMKPDKRYSIDRIDNNGNYEPSNCRWASPKQQANNKKNNNYITHKGIALTLQLWAEKIGIKPQTLRGRLSNGWSTERALKC